MDELASTEFRKRYASLREPVVVTVSGHPIGTWTPMHPASAEAFSYQMSKANMGGVTAHEADTHLRQAKRDDLLRKINRKEG